MNTASCLSHLYPGIDLLRDATIINNVLVAWRRSEPEPSAEALQTAWPAARLESGLSRVRIIRKRLLEESDWTQISDSPLSPEAKAAWGMYRQALRDLPQALLNADWDGEAAVSWPEAP